MMGFLKCPRSSWASKLDAHPLSFFDELSYIYSSSASVAWQSLLLALTSIDGHLPSPLISRVNVRLSPFCLLHTTPSLYSIPPIVLCPWLTLMYCMKVEKVWKKIKYETSAWLKPGLCMIWVFCVTKMDHSQTIWFCRDKLSLAMLYWEDIIALLVCLKYYYFYVNIKLLSWIFRIWTFKPK